MLTFNALARSNLVLPLSWHDLRIDSSDFDTRVQTCFVVRIDNVTAKDTAGANTTVVRALRTWEPTLRPAVWPSVRTEERVFLFQAKPELVLRVGFHQSGGLVPVVELVWRSIRIPGLTHDNDIWLATPWVGENRARSDVDIGIVTRSLVGRRSVEVPLREIINTLWWFAQGLVVTLSVSFCDRL